MLRYLRLPLRFDVPRMNADLRGLLERSWRLHYQALQYEGRWTALALRSLSGDVDDLLISPERDSRYQDTPLVAECPYLREVLATFQSPLKAVRLMRLEPGAEVSEHRDAELNFERGEVRLHVPIRTHPDVVFTLEGERLDLRAGECWYVNFDLPHAVRNPSSMDRVHLVMDLDVDPWLDALFTDPRGAPRSEEDPLDRLSKETKQAMLERFRAMGTPTGDRLAGEMERRLS